MNCLFTDPGTRSVVFHGVGEWQLDNKLKKLSLRRDLANKYNEESTYASKHIV